MILHTFHGWVNSEEMENLYELAVRHPPVLEVGCFHGLSTSALAQAADVTVIDTFDGSAEHSEGERRDILPRFVANMRAAGLLDRITIRIGRSQDIMPRLAGPYGMIFLDGSHEAADVLSDMRCARALIKDNGVIVFDDRHWPGVRDAADQVLPGWVPCAGKTGIWEAPATAT